MHQPLYGAAAAGYDEAFARVAREFVPTLLKAGRRSEGADGLMSYNVAHTELIQ
jgi:hypothetical protein